MSIENLQKVEADVIKALLCDVEFTKVRTELLGQVKHEQQLDESLYSEDDETLLRAIKAFRNKELNCLPATVVHIKDVERVLMLHESSFERINVEDEGRGCGCVDALTNWRQSLLLLCTGENTYSTGKQDDLSDQSKLPRHSLKVCGIQGSCISAAKTLLGKDDAWSLSDPSEKSSSSKKSFRNRKGRNKSIDAGTLSAAINADISQLKTELSIARSLLSLAKFAQGLASKNTLHLVPSVLQEEIALCLRDAITILSSISKTLQIIMSVGDLEEDDLDDSTTLSGGPALCIQMFALKRAESKPLFSLTGIFLAECWFLLGKISASQSTSKNFKDKLLMVACFDRALLILSSSKEITSKHLLEQLTKHKVLLQSNINRES